jgi:hypothetical protein
VSTIEKPFLFNVLKHHLSHQKDYIRCYVNDIPSLKADLAIIGNSQMDVYCGSLGVERISTDILKFINNSFTVSKQEYSKYILKHNNFFVVSISDHSEWVLRKGIDPDRYIHFHPARYSCHTFRVNANTLKTLIAAGIIADGSIGLAEINSARKVLDLDPVKKLSPDQGIGKFLRYFNR